MKHPERSTSGEHATPEESPTNGPCVLSVGHSNHTMEAFIDLLRAQQIEVVVDVRSEPYSSYSPHFSLDALRAALGAKGVRHVYLGRELGGHPSGDAFYDSEGYVRYDLVAESPAFHEGLRRLEEGLRAFRVAIMCSEEDPTHCHRRLLVSRVLESQGIRVEHLRADGRRQTEADLREVESRQRGEWGQMLLFDDLKETSWRSSRSVLQKGARSSSSER